MVLVKAGLMEFGAGEKFYLDRTSDSYLIYNSSTGKVELYVGGSKKQAW